MEGKKKAKHKPAGKKRALRILRWANRASLALLMLPVHILLLLWVIVTRFSIFIATIILCGYFVLTTYVTGPFVFAILNEQLMGTFNADYIDLRVLPTRVQIFNLRITHPDGRDLIHARRVETSVDSLDLAVWGVKQGLGIVAELPLGFRDILVDGYQVLLPFDEDGFNFPEAFMPKVITHDDEPSGPPPVVTLSHIQLGRGKVLLDFRSWHMDVDVARVLADMRIKGDGNLQLNARSIQVDSFQLLDLLPEQVAFVGELPSKVNVARFTMDRKKMQVIDAGIVHPDLEVRLETFEFAFSKEGMPVESEGEVTVLSPHRVEQLTGGQVFGSATVRFKMLGSLLLPDFEFRIKSDRLMVAGLELEDLDAQTRLDLHDGTEAHVPTAHLELMGSEIDVNDVLVNVGGGEIPEVTFNGCFQGLRPALVGLEFEVEEVLPYVEILVSGCCHGCRLGPGRKGLSADGGLSLTIDSGNLYESTGIKGGAVEAFVSWNGKTVRWDGLSVTTAMAHLSSVGYLDITPELGGRVDAVAYVTDLSEFPPLGALGIRGGVEVDDLVFTGTLEAPDVRAKVYLDDITVAGESFSAVDLETHYGGGEVAFSRFCFVHRDNRGCLSARAELGEGLVPDIKALPVEVTIVDPVQVELAELPYLSLPLRGSVTLGPLEARGTATENLLESLASFDVEGKVLMEDFALDDADVRLDRIHVGFIKKPARDAGEGIGPVTAEVVFKQLTVPEVTIRAGEVRLDLARLEGLDGSGMPFAIGEAAVNASGISIGREQISQLELGLVGQGEPRRVVFEGKTQLAPRVGFSFSGDWLPEEMLASLKLSTTGFPVTGLPPSLLTAELRELFENTSVTARIATRNIDLAEFIGGNIRRAFGRMTANGQVTVEGLEKLPEPVTSVGGFFRLSQGAVKVRPLLVKLRNGTKLRLDGSVWPFRSRINAHIVMSPTELNSLKTVRELNLPLNAVVAADLNVEGSWLSPEVRARLDVNDLVAVDIALGDAALNVEGKVGETLEFSSTEFFPGFKLTGGSLVFGESSIPETVNLGLDFSGFDLARVVPLPELIKVVADGQAGLNVDMTGRGEPFELAVDIPSNELSACVNTQGFAMCMLNPGPSRVTVTSTGVHVDKLRMFGDGHTIFADGFIRFVQGWDLDVGAVIDLARLEMLGEFLASYSGTVGSPDQLLHLAGPITAPRVSGAISLKDLYFLPRQLGSEIAVPAASIRLSGPVLDGSLVAYIEEDAPILGQFDEGEFSVWGWFRTREFLPDAGLINLVGKEIYYQAPGQYRLVLSPAVEVTLRNLASEGGGGGLISGDIFVSEGEFTQNFDRLIGSFTTAFSRTQERYSKPITETLPFLKKMVMDLRIRGGNFAVSSRFPFGETELTVNLDLKVAGTLEDLKLFDWMHLVPGGTITYKVVKRVFSVTRGSVDFSGDPGKPYVDVEAITEVPHKSQSGLSGLDEDLWGEKVPIKIRLTGEYPNLTPEFTSDKPGYDPADLQTLLLLGMTRKDLEGQGEGGQADVSINLLTDDVAGMVSNLLMAPFVDAVSLGFTQKGGVLAEAATKIGRAINLSARAKKESEAHDYSAGIQFKITDRLSLEGRMKSSKESLEEGQRTGYEAKFRYIIPLD